MNCELRNLLLFLTCCLSCISVVAQGGSGVYVGGHIRRERPKTIETLKSSGFTYVILFNVNVETDGTLTTDGETICRDGQYVFDETQPNYIDDVKALKAWPTSIERIEICIGGWGNESYIHIKDLVNKEGTGEGSILYRNFKALKDAIPEIDAVNNDDEHGYHAATAVKFHTMMYDLGYTTTVAPYTNKSFWQSLVNGLNSQRPGACERVLIQCYDGGAGNNPSDWKLGGLPVHAGRTNYQTDMETSLAQMQTWKDNNGVEGGFVWVYNDETWNLNKWASAMNRIFPTKTTSVDGGLQSPPVATLYSENNFEGYAVELPEGSYSTGELAAWGITNKDVASFRLAEGYRLTAYVNGDLTGSSKSWTDSELARMGAWGNRLSSLKIECLDEVTGINEIHSSQNSALCTIYDLQGRRVGADNVSARHNTFIIIKDSDGNIRKLLNSKK